MSGAAVLRLLLLAGTAEARALAAQLAVIPGLEAVASLAGAVSNPRPLALPTRVGGFGGAGGLERHLRAERVDAVVDATHPFAAQITSNARAACAAADAAYLRLARRPWAPLAGAAWLQTESASAAMAGLPPGARPFLALGQSGVSAAALRPDLRCALRMIEPPAAPAPEGATVITTCPPYPLEEEVALFQRLAITHLLAKNAGGAPGRAKLEAARQVGAACVLIAPPPEPPGAVYSADDALAWIAARLKSAGRRLD